MHCRGCSCLLLPPPAHHPTQEASLVAQMVKHLPAMQETQVWSLSREVPLEKEMATHSGNLAWEVPWTRDPGENFDSPWFEESDTTEQLTFSTPKHLVPLTFCIIYLCIMFTPCFSSLEDKIYRSGVFIHCQVLSLFSNALHSSHSVDFHWMNEWTQVPVLF